MIWKSKHNNPCKKTLPPEHLALLRLTHPKAYNKITIHRKNLSPAQQLNSFDWAASPQGHDFWLEIFITLDGINHYDTNKYSFEDGTTIKAYLNEQKR